MEFFSGFLLLAFGLAHLAPLAAPFVYRAAEAKHRAEWQEFTLPKVTLDVSAYRSGGPVVPGHLERAPALVRFAAASCFVFGSMFLPGLAWALVGLVAAGAGLLGIPGLIIAGWLWSAGRGLLRGTKEGAVSAARAATVSAYFNVFLVLGGISVTILAPDEGFRVLAAFTSFYACLSLAQAIVVAKAAHLVAEHHGDDFDTIVDSHLPIFLRHLLARKRLRAA